MSMTRRQFSNQLLGAIGSWCLLNTLAANRAFGAAVEPLALKWIDELDQMAGDLRNQNISLQEWQQQSARFFDQVSLEDMLRFVDFDQLTRGFQFAERGVSSWT